MTAAADGLVGLITKLQRAALARGAKAQNWARSITSSVSELRKASGKEAENVRASVLQHIDFVLLQLRRESANHHPGEQSP